MFAAASGARLAHRHNKTAQKQLAAGQIEGFQVGRGKGLPKHHFHHHHGQPIKYSDVAAFRYPGLPQRRLPSSSKLYSSHYNPGLKLSTSYIDINGRISNLGQFDFEGKAAWQDREFGHDLDRRELICIPSEVHCSSKLRQKEAHRRWVRKNRIQDLSLGDHNSDEEELLYGVQNGAANLLLYVGLGTMCVGMIIAFVGTGEKGFKTMELRLIGPSLIGAGVLIIILRVLLCVCPSKCLQLRKKKHKLKNSTNKLNSETNDADEGKRNSVDATTQPGDELPTESKNVEKNAGGGGGTSLKNKKRVSIAMPPIISDLSTNIPTSSSSYSSRNFKSNKPPSGFQSRHPPLIPLPLLPSTTYQENAIPMLAVSFTEREKPSSSKGWTQKSFGKIGGHIDKKAEEGDSTIQVTELTGNDLDAISFGSVGSCGRRVDELPETLPTPDVDISTDPSASVTSGLNEFSAYTKNSADKGTVTATTATATTPPFAFSSSSKFEMTRNPKNLATTELVLSPSALNESNDNE